MVLMFDKIKSTMLHWFAFYHQPISLQFHLNYYFIPEDPEISLQSFSMVQDDKSFPIIHS